MEAQDLEWRMYGLVPYNISPIQQAIQYGHALQEYNNNMFDFVHTGDEYSTKELKDWEAFEKWRTEDKTFIILNGGTTNDDVSSKFYGTMNKHAILLQELGIEIGTFYEPDLGDQLTGVVFLVDERVWNSKKYPDFVPTNGLIKDVTRQMGYDDWVVSIGGTTNVFLRDFLRQLKLA